MPNLKIPAIKLLNILLENKRAKKYTPLCGENKVLKSEKPILTHHQEDQQTHP